MVGGGTARRQSIDLSAALYISPLDYCYCLVCGYSSEYKILQMQLQLV